MKLAYNLEIQFNGKKYDVNVLDRAIGDYMTSCKMIKKNSTAYVNLNEGVVYFVEKDAHGEIKSNTSARLADIVALAEQKLKTKVK